MAVFPKNDLGESLKKLGKGRMKLSLSNVVVRWLLGSLVLAGTGCRSSVRVTDTPQTGTQQLLLNASVDAVVRCIDFSPLAGREVYLDATRLEAAGDGYLVYRIREKLARSGVRLAESRDEGEVIVEAGLAAYGTDSHTAVFGITETDQLPELNLCIRDTQFGVAKLSMFARERESGEVIWHSGPMRADGYQRMRKLFGFGPFFDGTVEHPTNRVRRLNSGIRSL